MYIKAVKLTQDHHSIKVVYQKGDKVFVRNGSDKFSRGTVVNTPLSALVNNMGYQKVESAPYFYDGKEISENIHKFSRGANGTALYSG